MGRVDKLLKKALNAPQNLKFREFCSLLESFDMELRKTPGSHRVYKRTKDPKFAQSAQNYNGMAKPYQVKQFINQLHKHGLLKERDE